MVAYSISNKIALHCMAIKTYNCRPFGTCLLEPLSGFVSLWVRPTIGSAHGTALGRTVFKKKLGRFGKLYEKNKPQLFPGWVIHRVSQHFPSRAINLE